MDSNKQVTYNIILHTSQNIIDQRINIFYVVKDLSEIGDIRSINPLPAEAGEEERWSLFLVGNMSQEEVEDALMFVFEYCIISKVADFDIFDSKKVDNYQQAILAEEQAFQLKNKPESIPEFTESKPLDASVKSGNFQSTIESIRKNMNRVAVDSEKLEYLMYLVSELITTSSQLNLMTVPKEYIKIRSQVEKLDKLSKLFRNNALEIRLIPMRDIVPKFNRLVRDISLDLGKEVEFITEGMETELDKSSIDMVAEPLVHMLRNALDHGIELPEERQEKGKPAKGKIKLRAYNAGNNIFIEVSDDGKGLDHKKILAKAIEKGMIADSDKLNKVEAFDLICMPGFSTAKEVTSISGRGVGMDVVKQKIIEMRGELEITSQPDKGSTFTIKLQQSIAILDTLLIRADNMKCLVPLSDVEVCSQCEYEEVERRQRQGTLEFENELIPFASMPSMFELRYQKPKMAKIVVVRKNNKRFAIITDEIIGQHQAVLKPMGEMVKRHEQISAASILGNGEVAFLLNTSLFNYKMTQLETA